MGRMTGELENRNDGVRADSQIFGAGYGKGTGWFLNFLVEVIRTDMTRLQDTWTQTGQTNSERFEVPAKTKQKKPGGGAQTENQNLRKCGQNKTEKNRKQIKTELK